MFSLVLVLLVGAIGGGFHTTSNCKNMCETCARSLPEKGSACKSGVEQCVSAVSAFQRSLCKLSSRGWNMEAALGSS